MLFFSLLSVAHSNSIWFVIHTHNTNILTVLSRNRGQMFHMCICSYDVWIRYILCVVLIASTQNALAQFGTLPNVFRHVQFFEFLHLSFLFSCLATLDFFSHFPILFLSFTHSLFLHSRLFPLFCHRCTPMQTDFISFKKLQERKSRRFSCLYVFVFTFFICIFSINTTLCHTHTTNKQIQLNYNLAKWFGNIL